MIHSRAKAFEDSNQPERLLTELVLEVFRLNGKLLTASDYLVGDLGLTSARWQVLGAIALSPVPLPVAHIAKNMGLTRQSVQRIVDEMRADGLVHLKINPHHRRAMLVTMTVAGQAAHAAASARQKQWARDLTHGLSTNDIEAASMLLRALRQLLDAMAGRTPTDPVDTFTSSSTKGD